MGEKKEYIERGALIGILDAKFEMAIGAPKAVFASVSGMVNLLPAADVVEVETVKKWLYRMALNNVGCFLDGDFSVACEEIISRLDGLRKFAKEMKGGEQT